MHKFPQSSVANYLCEVLLPLEIYIFYLHTIPFFIPVKGAMGRPAFRPAWLPHG